MNARVARAVRVHPDARVILRLDAVSKRYGRGAGAVTALNDVTVKFHAATLTAVMGPSGSGKSTLLHCAAGLEQPTSGTVWLGEVDVTRMREPALTVLRRERVGFVSQGFNLLPSLNAEENILLPFRLAEREPDRAWVHEVVTRMGLTDRLRHRPAQLSGGQQQRVAFARALVNSPEVILADEPTGNLDRRAGQELLAMLRDAVDGLAQTVVVVTHDPLVAAAADRVVFLVDGRLVDELPAPTAREIVARVTRMDAGA